MTLETFMPEMLESVGMFEKYIVALEKTPPDFRDTLISLMQKAIVAYQTRTPGLRHGIALDKFVTIILSQQGEGERPLCGIYFNLHTPYVKNPLKK